MKSANKGQSSNGAPSYGIKEGDLLTMKSQLRQLTLSHNNMVEELRNLQKMRIVEKVQESHALLQMVFSVLISKGVATEQELNQMIQDFQADAESLKDKGPDAVAEAGDTMLIKFKLYHNQDLIDDQSKNVLAYELGSQELPCDADMIGMKAGEVKFIEVVFSREGFRFEQYRNVPLIMELVCVGLKRKVSRAAEAPTPTSDASQDETAEKSV